MLFVLTLCIIASFADVLGGVFTVVKRLNAKEMLIVTGLGTGFLLGATVLDRMPSSMSELPSTAPLYIILGYLSLLILERYGVHRHRPSGLGKHHQIESQPRYQVNAAMTFMNPTAALMSFIGLLFHTFMDGVIIAGAFSISRSTGLLIFLAITMHKIPEGFSMATISLSAGSSRKRALLTSCALATSTMLGAFITIQLGSIDAQLVKVLMALATGTFLFVSTTDMVPAIKGQSTSAVLSIILGVSIFYISLLLVQHVGLG